MACSVKINRHGRLAFRLYWSGIESWEGTGLKDTSKNRQRLEARAVLITEEMEHGEFDYLKWFPQGNKANLLRPKPSPDRDSQEKTVGEFYAEWIKTKRPPLVRASLERDYRLCFDFYILPPFKDVALSGVVFAKLQGFQIHLVEEKKLSVKTARNIIGGCFRAMMRDARKQGLVKREAIDDAFQLTWPRISLPAPDPFTTEERDKILGYFKAKTSPVDYSFLLTLFWTGMRPSEAIALRWSDIDLARGKASITKSRHMKAEAPTKTRASVRTASLLPAVVEALDQIYQLRATEDDYVFHDSSGNPLDAQDWMWKHWNKALRACGVRQRKFYNTRHTYISTAVTAGVNLKWVSEQTGTSIRMIEERYGRYIRDDGDALLRALSQTKTETFTETFEGERGKSGKNMVVPTGIEPVLPT
jgi:integrase